jgi:hypothetical protein
MKATTIVVLSTIEIPVSEYNLPNVEFGTPNGSFELTVENPNVFTIRFEDEEDNLWNCHDHQQDGIDIELSKRQLNIDLPSTCWMTVDFGHGKKISFNC